VTKGFSFLAKQMLEAASGGKEAQQTFRTLGVEFQNADGTLRETNTVFAELADKFAAMPDGAAKVALGQKLIGKGFVELIPMINEGGDAIRNVAATISTEFANRAALFNDTIDIMKAKTAGLVNEGLNELLKYLQQILEVYKSVSVEGGTMATVFAGIGNAVKGLVIVIDTLVTGTRQAIATLQYFGETLFYLTTFQFDKAKQAASARLDEIVQLGSDYKDRINKLLAPPTIEVPTVSGLRGGIAPQIVDEESLKAQADAAEREIDRIGRIFDKLKEDQQRRAEEIKREGEKVFEATRTPAERLAAELENLNKLLEAGAINWDTYSRAVFQAQDNFDKASKSIKDENKTLFQALEEAVKGFGKKFTDTFVEMVETGKFEFKGLVKSILSDIARIAIQKGITDPLIKAATSFLPFANGGIMTSQGSMPLKKYASGGIANSPQVALFGEGSRPEAYVPLPDGRTIPVTMNGGGSTNVSVVVNVESGETSTRADDERGKQLGTIVAKVVREELLNQKRPGGILATA